MVSTKIWATKAPARGQRNPRNRKRATQQAERKDGAPKREYRRPGQKLGPVPDGRHEQRRGFQCHDHGDDNNSPRPHRATGRGFARIRQRICFRRPAGIFRETLTGVFAGILTGVSAGIFTGIFRVHRGP